MTNLARLVGNSCSNGCQLGAGSNLFAMLSAALLPAGLLCGTLSQTFLMPFPDPLMSKSIRAFVLIVESACE